MTISLNMGSVSKGFEPMPDGQIALRLVKFDMVDTKTGRKMLKAEFDVTEPSEFAAEKRKMWDQFVLVDQSLWVLQAFLEAITGQPWQEDDMELDPSDLLGEYVIATITTESYEDPKRRDSEGNPIEKFKNVITGYFPYEEGAIEPF